jgi:hypothetical protein
MKRSAISLALLLGGCTSSYQAVRLDSSGDYTGLSSGQTVGVPFTLTKPEFTIKKIEGSDPERYQITAAYVPDPSQRFALRLDPTWLSKIDFNMVLGPGGGLTSTSADVKDQIIPFATSMVKLAASAAQMAAALSVTDQGVGAGACLSQAGIGRLAQCAIESVEDPACARAKDGIKARIDRALIGDKDDKGAVLETLFARTDDESKCFALAAKGLEDAVTAAGTSVNTKFAEGVADSVLTSQADANKPITLLAAKTTQVLTGAVAKRDVSKARKLVYSTKLATEGKPQYLQKLLELPTAPTASDAASIYAVFKTIKLADGAEPVLALANGEKVQKAFAGLATMTAGQWRARFIPVLQYEQAEAERKALIAAPGSSDEAGFRKIASDRRRMLASLVNMAAEQSRLEKLDAILDRVPAFSTADRRSRITEYQGYSKQAADIRTELAARLAAAVATEKAAKKEAVLPISLPWVTQACIKQSTEQEGWIHTAGADAPEYVIVLRNASGDIQPPPPAPVTNPEEIQMPECGA